MAITVNVTGGTLNSNNATALGSLAVVNVAANANFGLGAGQTLGSVERRASAVNLNGNTLTVGGPDNLPSNFNGSIGDGIGAAGSGGLTKAGTATFILGSASNSGFTGPTKVNAGSPCLSMVS